MGLLDKLKEQALGLSGNLIGNTSEEVTHPQPSNAVTPPSPTPTAPSSTPTAPSSTSKQIYNEQIENLIEMALADGELTEKEKQVLFKKAEAQGIDLDEFEMVLDAKLFEKQKISTILGKYKFK